MSFNLASSIAECLPRAGLSALTELQKMQTCLPEAYSLEREREAFRLMSRPPSGLSAALEGTIP